MPEKYVIARYVAKNHVFEILVDPDLALRVKEGREVNIDELVVSDFVYKDAKKGLKASPESLRSVFGTEDIRQIALEIVRKGEIQLTTEQRKKIIEDKKKQLINLIAKTAIDPKTKMPIPPTRIENALEQAKISIDPFKPVEQQVEEIVSKLSKYIPIKLAKAVLSLKIPPEHGSRIFKLLAKYGEVKKQNWMSDGSLVIEIEIPAGLQQEFIDKVNEFTSGSAYIKIVSIG
ncbi:MAG: ribosome assembly factor SBDS [Desulfurococcaceae archaeon]|uniref:Ribosome assembly factor SBDS n=1 Tax=Staphylothermus marinus TaxID=2280 RepID=A0A7C4D6H8_STAMA